MPCGTSMGQAAGPSLAAGLALLACGPGPAQAQTQTRAIDTWSVVVLYCPDDASPPWTGRACQALAREMKSRAEAAKVGFIAVQGPASDADLDRRAGTDGFDMFRVIHARFTTSPADRVEKGWHLALMLRALLPGMVGSLGRDGPYHALAYRPSVLVGEAQAARDAVAAMPDLADAFFMPMTKLR